MKQNNHWWESYFVRYLAGNIFSVIVIFYLFLNYGDKIGDRFCNTDLSQQYQICKLQKTDDNLTISKKIFSLFFQSSTTTYTENILSNTKQTTEITLVNIILIGIFGFLYMYISSIPIYLMHIFRFGCSHQGLKKSASIRDAITDKKSCCKNCLFIFGCSHQSLRKSYYKNNFSPTYIESYQHLREHGNAFGIIIMQILFAVYLICSNFSIWAIALWIMFGFIGWFYGIYLEFKMIDENYLGLWSAVCILLCLILFIGLIYLSSMQCNL